MVERRFAFDDIADLYGAVRPSYPAELFADVVAEAGLKPGDRLLEVGCGAGNATQALVGKGFQVLALDPGAQLVRVARERLAQARDVDFQISTFEDWPLERGAFSLIYAAQAWHWVDPAVGFANAAAALAPHGVLAVFGNVGIGPAEPLRSALVDVYERLGPSALPPPAGGSWYTPGSELPGLFRQSAQFDAAIHNVYAWSARYSAASFADYQRTTSSHRVLAQDVRERLLDEVVAVIEAYGGQVEIPWEAHLHMAHRRGPRPA